MKRALAIALLAVSLVAQTPKPAGNLNQMMRGMLYPAANIIFTSQTDDPAEAKLPPGKDPTLATDPMISVFGGWQAVENAALALVESADLLATPGRVCSNGVAAPIKNADWAKFTQELRDAGMKAYKAAQTKNQDNMIAASDTLSDACAHCHLKWREKRAADRCK